MATNTHERRNYANAVAAATGKRIIYEDAKVREIVCDSCDGAGFHNGIPCETYNTRGWTQQVKTAKAVEQFQVR